MTLEKTIQILKQNQPKINTQILTNCHNFLKKEASAFSFLDKQNIYNQGTEKALNAAQNKAGITFIAAAYLFELSAKDSAILKNIKKVLGNDIYYLNLAYLTAKETSKPNTFDHLYNTACKISETQISKTAICAALLHDIKDIHTIKNLFGSETAKLVDRYQKIKNIKFSQNTKYTNNLREMIIAMAEDLRVIIIKMCSNIDKMRNSSLYDQETIAEIANESMDILAPIADLLGIWRLRWQLEDLSFQILQPAEYTRIAKRFNVDEKKNREKYIQKTKNILIKATDQVKINCQIDGRFKHFYSIYKKMKLKNKRFNDITDVFALRVIVDDIDSCYRMLGLIHRLWKPKKRRIKDYIAAPKNNNYKSLHTTVFGINGRLTEFQIRTKEMDEQAKYGIAAHWNYKNNISNNPPWIQEMLVKQQKYQDDEEFLSNFSSEFLNNRIYVYSPKGDVIALPIGSTPVDFAYHIHTEIGDHCASAIINDMPASLNEELATHDVVEIIVDRQQPGPKAEWLKFVKAESTKKHIENKLLNHETERLNSR